MEQILYGIVIGLFLGAMWFALVQVGSLAKPKKICQCPCLMNCTLSSHCSLSLLHIFLTSTHGKCLRRSWLDHNFIFFWNFATKLVCIITND